MLSPSYAFKKTANTGPAEAEVAEAGSAEAKAALPEAPSIPGGFSPGSIRIGCSAMPTGGSLPVGPLPKRSEGVHSRDLNEISLFALCGLCAGDA